jgi:hypothetical protein
MCKPQGCISNNKSGELMDHKCCVQLAIIGYLITLDKVLECQARSVRPLACLGYCGQRYGNSTLLVRTATDRPYLR